MSSGKGSVTDSTSGAKDTFQVTPVGCKSGASSEGDEVIYKVTLEPGAYRLILKPESSFDAQLYVFTSCADAQASCIAGTDLVGDGGTETVYVAPSTTVTYYIAVDSRRFTEYGSYTLTIEKGAAPANDTCSSATALTLTSGKANAVGSTLFANNSVQLSSTGCTKGATSGSDVFYSFLATAGKSYKVTATPTSVFAIDLYVFSGCSNPSSTCVTGKGTVAGAYAKVIFTASQTGTFFIGVDSSSTLYPWGTFLLAVEEIQAPTNDACGSATALSLTTGKATASGDTSLASNDVALTWKECASNSTPGRDVFYSFSAAAGKTYSIVVTPEGDTYNNLIVYVFTSCASPASTCVAGEGTSDEIVIHLTPTTSGTHFIAVDNVTSWDYGKFTLTIEEIQAPTNDTCSSATTLNLTSGKAKGSGDTWLADNSVTLASTDCTGASTTGTDVFYSFSPTAGKEYKVTVQPLGVYYDAVYAFTDCSSVGASCLAGADSSSYNDASILKLTGPSSGKVYIGVDGEGTSWAKGSFELTVEEVTPLTNDKCSSPQAISFSSGFVTVSGDTTEAKDEFPTLSCSSSNSFKHPQLYYRASLTGGKTYTVLVVPKVGFDVAVYAFKASTTCSVTSIDKECAANYAQNGSTGIAETITITPSVSEDWIIVVDSSAPWTSNSYGTFTLMVTET